MQETYDQMKSYFISKGVPNPDPGKDWTRIDIDWALELSASARTLEKIETVSKFLLSVMKISKNCVPESRFGCEINLQNGGMRFMQPKPSRLRSKECSILQSLVSSKRLLHYRALPLTFLLPPLPSRSCCMLLLRLRDMV
jgi:hypothetical protein